MSLPKSILDRDHGAYELAGALPARRVKVVNDVVDPIPVAVVSENGFTPLLVSNKINALAVNASADILTYEVPIDSKVDGIGILVSSTNVSTIEVSVNSTTIATIYLSWFNFNQRIDFKFKSLLASDVIRVSATNDSTSTGDYSCTLEGAIRGS